MYLRSICTGMAAAASLPVDGGGRGTGPCSLRRGKRSMEGNHSILAPEEEEEQDDEYSICDD
jgi:hypothetical protein